jgi:hypothetical protein
VDNSSSCHVIFSLTEHDLEKQISKMNKNAKNISLTINPFLMANESGTEQVFH